mmetsp:Transcript_24314/g.37170  ORF Transcript_24314/g.37170 Transcript_24314/m.37170 type:complete len:93 (+) Transcript_24314:1067-1345(+)
MEVPNMVGLNTEALNMVGPSLVGPSLVDLSVMVIAVLMSAEDLEVSVAILIMMFGVKQMEGVLEEGAGTNAGWVLANCERSYLFISSPPCMQ